MNDVVMKFFRAVLDDIRNLGRGSSFDGLHRFFSFATSADLRVLYEALHQQLEAEPVKAEPSKLGEWEYLQWDEEGSSIYARRLRVSGGWLYQVQDNFRDRGESIRAFHPPVFVPELEEAPRPARDTQRWPQTPSKDRLF